MSPYIGVRPLAHGAAACAVTKACALTPPSLALYAPPLLLLPAVPSGHRPGCPRLLVRLSPQDQTMNSMISDSRGVVLDRRRRFDDDSDSDVDLDGL